MASNDALLLNPYTPLAWLPPNIAGQLEASRYLYAATVGAWIWDYIMSLGEEIQMFRRFKVSFCDLIYAIARLTSLVFILLCLIFQVAPVSNCHALAKTIGWCGAFALPLNSLLFYFRIRAVFSESSAMLTFFGFLWMSTFTAIAAPFGVDGVHIGTTRYCVNSDVKSYSSAGIVAVAVHDTLVFLAITTRLVMLSLADTWSARFKAFLGGNGMGNVSKALLHSGQLYYLATVGMNIVTMVLMLTPEVPPVLRAMFAIPNTALQNAMACRVYRQLKLGLIRDDGAVCSRSAANTTRIKFATHGSSGHETTTMGTLDMTPTNRSGGDKSSVVQANADKEVETSGDPPQKNKKRSRWGIGGMV